MCNIDGICCEITKDGENRVSEVKLERNNLKGFIPDTFYKLSNAKIFAPPSCRNLIISFPISPQAPDINIFLFLISNIESVFFIKTNK